MEKMTEEVAYVGQLISVLTDPSAWNTLPLHLPTLVSQHSGLKFQLLSDACPHHQISA